MGKGDKSVTEVDFEVAEGGSGEKENMVVEGVNREVKVVVEILVTFLGDDDLRVASNQEEVNCTSEDKSNLVVRSGLRFLV